MAKHAKLSASQTERWWECPGSQALDEAQPERRDESGYHAQLGTAAHCLSEESLAQGKHPSAFLGRIIKLDADENATMLAPRAKAPKDPSVVWFEVDQAMVDGVEEMTEYVIARLVELEAIDEGFNDEERYREAANLASKRDHLQLESQTVPLPHRDDTGGTADVTIDAWPDMLEVVDYKNGAGVFVPIEGNKQLRSYLLGKAIETGWSHERYRYSICQPNHPDSQGVRFEEVTREELKEWAVELDRRATMVDKAREAVAAGASIDRLYEMGAISVGQDGKHCTFCSRKTTCPAAFAKAQALAMNDFDEAPSEIDAPGENRLAVILPWVPFLDKWIRELEADAERLLLTGKKIEGYKIVRKRTNRGWRTKLYYHPESECYMAESDPEEASVGVEEVELTDDLVARIMADKFGVQRGQLIVEQEPKRLTGPQAEKLVDKKLRAEFNSLLLHKPQGDLCMAPESDKREAVEVDPGSDFEDDLDG